jgi:16S rRNA (adenine1518-N6/adenine1519-N6)-dimethyltransferase
MNRRLGQHFLKNRGKIKEIIDSLELKRGDIIVEIGAGHGELTGELLTRQDIKVIAIEKDKRLVEELKGNFQFPISNFQTNSNNRNPKLEIVHGDILKELPSLIQNSSYKVVGNIPYYITGKLLRILGELELKPELIVLTIQKEVAERVCAESPKMNLLAASVQFWAAPEIVSSISKKDFEPPPEVDSAIMRLKTKPPFGDQLLATSYYKLIKILFKQPRKTILNNLSDGLKLNKDEITKELKKLKINPASRPQNLDIQNIQKLIRAFM